MQSVHSSHVERVGYDMEAKELHVGWKDGGRSVYSGVPADVAHDTMTSWSVGNALRTRIKPHYQHRYAD
jgi:hypothetical protein